MAVTLSFVPSDEIITLDTVLDGTSYRLKLYYSDRYDRWYISILSSDGAPLVQSRKLVINQDLLAPYDRESLGLPPGALKVAAIGTDSALSVPEDGPPGFEDLGQDPRRAILIYFSQDEVAFLSFLDGVLDPIPQPVIT